MVLFSFHILFVITVAIKSVSTAKIFEMCYSHFDCPLDSSCKPNSCNGYVCLCNPGSGANYDYTGCKKVSFIGEPCTKPTDCPFLAYCNNNNKCECYSTVRETDTIRKHCVYRNRKALGEKCSQSIQCPRFSECKKLRCVCETGYRAKTDDEYWSNALAKDDCIKDDFSLDKCGSVTIAIPSALLVTSSSTVEYISSYSVSSTDISSIFQDVATSTIYSTSSVSQYPSIISSVSIETSYDHQQLTSISEDISTAVNIESSTQILGALQSTEVLRSETVFLDSSSNFITGVANKDTSTVSASIRSSVVSSIPFVEATDTSSPSLTASYMGTAVMGTSVIGTSVTETSVIGASITSDLNIQTSSSSVQIVPTLTFPIDGSQLSVSQTTELDSSIFLFPAVQSSTIIPIDVSSEPFSSLPIDSSSTLTVVQQIATTTSMLQSFDISTASIGQSLPLLSVSLVSSTSIILAQSIADATVSSELSPTMKSAPTTLSVTPILDSSSSVVTAVDSTLGNGVTTTITDTPNYFSSPSMIMSGSISLSGTAYGTASGSVSPTLVSAAVPSSSLAMNIVDSSSQAISSGTTMPSSFDMASLHFAATSANPVTSIFSSDSVTVATNSASPTLSAKSSQTPGINAASTSRTTASQTVSTTIMSSQTLGSNAASISTTTASQTISATITSPQIPGSNSASASTPTATATVSATITSTQTLGGNTASSSTPTATPTVSETITSSETPTSKSASASILTATTITSSQTPVSHSALTSSTTATPAVSATIVSSQTQIGNAATPSTPTATPTVSGTITITASPTVSETPPISVTVTPAIINPKVSTTTILESSQTDPTSTSPILTPGNTPTTPGSNPTTTGTNTATTGINLATPTISPATPSQDIPPSSTVTTGNTISSTKSQNDVPEVLIIVGTLSGLFFLLIVALLVAIFCKCGAFGIRRRRPSYSSESSSLGSSDKLTIPRPFVNVSPPRYLETWTTRASQNDMPIFYSNSAFRTEL